MRAETGNGLPTPVYWAFMSMVSRDAGTQNPAGAVGRQAGAGSRLRMLGVCVGWVARNPQINPGGPSSPGDQEGLPGTQPVGGSGSLSSENGAVWSRGWW